MKRSKPIPVTMYGWMSADNISIATAEVDKAMSDVVCDSDADVNDYRDYMYKVTVTIEEL